MLKEAIEELKQLRAHLVTWSELEPVQDVMSTIDDSIKELEFDLQQKETPAVKCSCGVNHNEMCQAHN